MFPIISWKAETTASGATYTSLFVNGHKTNVYWSDSAILQPVEIERQRAEFLAAQIAAGNITADNWTGWDSCRMETVTPGAAEILSDDVSPDWRNAVLHCRTCGHDVQESLSAALRMPTLTQLIKRIRQDADGRYLEILDRFGVTVGRYGYSLYYI